MILQYILDEHGEPQVCDDLMTWGRWFEQADVRRVALTETPHGDVSTVFLGLDHNFGRSGPPVLWETLVFGGPLDGEQDRYTSRADAVAGHEAMCLRVQQAMASPESAAAVDPQAADPGNPSTRV